MLFGVLVSMIVVYYSCKCEFFVDVGVVKLVGVDKM